MLSRALATLSVALFLTQITQAQDSPPIKVETHLVDTTISVHDSSGGLLNNLI